MEERYYLIKELTNTAGEDGSVIAVYGSLNSAIVAYHQLLAPLHNADDVLYAVVMIHDMYGRVVGGENGYKETVDHRPPAPTPEPEEE